MSRTANAQARTWPEIESMVIKLWPSATSKALIAPLELGSATLNGFSSDCVPLAQELLA
jgi:hypothetical protein